MKRTKQSTEVRLCKVCGQPLPKEYYFLRTMHPECANKKNKDAARKRQHRALLNVENRLRYECKYDTNIKNAKKHKREHICARCGEYSGKDILCGCCRETWKHICEIIDHHPELRGPIHHSYHLCLCCHKPVYTPYRQTCSKCRSYYARGKILDATGKIITKIPKFTEEQKRLQDKMLADAEQYCRLLGNKPNANEEIHIDPVTRRSTRRDIETGNVWEIEQRGQCFGYLKSR